MKRMTLVLLGLVAASSMGANAFAADVVYVHQMRGQEGEGTGTTPNAGEGTLAWEDDLWRALIEDAGHTITAHGAFDDFEFDESGLDILNAADVVVFSRDINSGDYNEPIEHELWTEGLTVPMLMMSPFTLRSNRWDMAASTGILETDKDANAVGNLVAWVPDHPIFAGALDANNEAEVFDPDALGPDDSIDFLNEFDIEDGLGNGTVLAIEPEFEVPWIVYWEEGAEFYDDSLYTAGGPRLHFSVGSDDDPYSWGEKNTTPAGDRIFLNAISWLAGEDQGAAGDFNADGQLGIEDINQLTQASASMGNDVQFDLNGDSAVNEGDILVWIKDLKNSWVGDANLDGEFNSGDLVAVFTAGKFEQELDANWSEGDWNGDGRFNSGDFVAGFSDGGFEQGARAAVNAVPEPSSAVLLGMGLIGLLRRRRASRRSA